MNQPAISDAEFEQLNTLLGEFQIVIEPLSKVFNQAKRII